MVNELQNVTDIWFQLGMNLDIPSTKLLEIEGDNKRAADCLCRMLIEWENRENPTWSKVVRALTAVRRPRLAQDLATRYGELGVVFATEQTIL